MATRRAGTDASTTSDPRSATRSTAAATAATARKPAHPRSAPKSAAKAIPAKAIAAKAIPAKDAAGPAQSAAKATPPKASAKAASAKAAPAKAAPAKAAPAKATAKAAAAKAAAAKAAPAKAEPARAGRPVTHIVPSDGEWTSAELAEIRAELGSQVVAMGSSYDESVAAIEDLQQHTTVGSGDDQADTGSATFEREQELSIAANRMDLIEQMQRAIDRIDAGTYGLCESCGKPIPKARLRAFPAATLDVECKQREERR
jgi:RNA polymerase-binding protein DksA